MINIGIDFGSTYTMVSTFSDGAPEIIGPSVGSYNYPTIVVYDKAKNKYYYGSAAKSKQSSANCVIFRGFKMLLNQQMTPENLKKRGYDDVNTPEHITELFLKYIIENTLSKTGEDKVGTLVLGAPECWFQSIDNVDARGTLHSICSKMEMVENVRIVSEPTNAAAYCVWNYKNDGFGDLTGSVLVIDYGGGTLDTAIVSISEFDGKMMIKPQLRAGAGENHDHEIGKGGIAYQEALARTAICEALDIDEKDFTYDPRFYQFLKQLEELLITSSGDIEEVFEEYKLTPDMLEDELFDTLDYKGEGIEINYAQMYKTYQKVIAPVLQQVLEETAEGLNEQESDIHIALVGGFNNFCLVKKQIYDFFKIGTKDTRTDGMVKKESEREQAIAHGAALFSGDVISLCNVAPFSIGTYAHFPDGSLCRQYAINYGQEIECDKIYFAHDDNGNPYPMFASAIDTFLLNFTKNEKYAIPMRPKPIFIKKLNSIKHGRCIVPGFSMDHADRITVHIYNYSLNKKKAEDTPVESITLSTLKDTFENTIITGGMV